MENKILELKDSVWMLSQPSPMPQELKDLIHDESADQQEKVTAINAWKAARYSTAEAAGRSSGTSNLRRKENGG